MGQLNLLIGPYPVGFDQFSHRIAEINSAGIAQTDQNGEYGYRQRQATREKGSMG